MVNKKFLQLCRNSIVYDSKSEAISALKTAFGKHKKDGELIIARYYTSTEKVSVKTLLGVSYYSGEGAVVHDTIIDVDAMPSEVQKVIDSLIGGASAEYSTLKRIEVAVKAEVERAKAAEKANADAITDERTRATGIERGLQSAIDTLNGADTVSGSVAKSIKDAVEALDVTAVGGQGKLITTVSEADGKISAIAIDATAANIAVVDKKDKFTATNVEDVLAEIDTAYKTADSAMDARVDSLEAAIGEGGSVEKQINDAIAKLDTTVGQASVADGKHVAVQVVETDGVITAVNVSESDIASAQGLADEITRATNAETALDGRLDVIEGEGEGSIKKAVADAKSDLLGDASPNYNTLGKLEDKIQAVEGAAKSYSVAALTSQEIAELADGANVREAYKLIDEDSQKAGQIIKIYKDSTLKNVELVNQVLQFTYILADGTQKTIGVDVSEFLAQTEFENGLVVNDNGKVSVKIDENSESFLTVGENGVNISGVQDAINTAKTAANQYADGLNTAMGARVDALKTLIGEGGSVETQINNAIANLDVPDAAVSTQYVSAVSENDGKISVTRANLVAAAADGNSNDMLSIVNGSIVLSNVFDMGTY